MTKQPKCKVCKAPFTRARPMQTWCSIDCAVTLGQKAVEKKKARAKVEDKKQTREKLDAMKTKPELVELAQKAFNSFVRARDAGKDCISCRRPLQGPQVGGAFDCGHYRSVGSAVHMRFVEENGHGQCKYCNSRLAGNHVEYRRGLVDRIGLEAVERIEADTTLRKYTHEDLREMAKRYRAEARRLTRERG